MPNEQIASGEKKKSQEMTETLRTTRPNRKLILIVCDTG